MVFSGPLLEQTDGSVWNTPTRLADGPTGFSGALRDGSLETGSVRGLQRAGLARGQPPHPSRSPHNTTTARTPECPAGQVAPRSMSEGLAGLLINMSLLTCPGRLAQDAGSHR